MLQHPSQLGQAYRSLRAMLVRTSAGFTSIKNPKHSNKTNTSVHEEGRLRLHL